MFDSFIIGALSSIAGALLVLAVQYAARRIQEHRSPFTGEWEDYIFDENGKVVKKDRISMRQRDDTVNGKIARIEPSSQNHRRWKFIGKIFGPNVFAIFWPVDKSIPSYGCWYVHQKDDFTFEGFYLKLDEGRDGKIHKVPIGLKRISNK